MVVIEGDYGYEYSRWWFIVTSCSALGILDVSSLHTWCHLCFIIGSLEDLRVVKVSHSLPWCISWTKSHEFDAINLQKKIQNLGQNCCLE